MTVEVAPGIHRIESDLGPRFMCQYALVGDERTLLVDTGLSETPERVIGPYLESLGSSLGAIDEVVITHADVDHCGGNRLLRHRNQHARFSCHELDRRWIESNGAMLAENYSWYETYGFGPDEEAKAWLRDELGGDAPMDVGLRGGETLRLSGDWRVEILHLPGHTSGHLGIWDPRSGAAVIVDAVLKDGIYDREGNRLIPPRYYELQAYRETIRRLTALGPDLLLTAHYPVLDAVGARAFLDRSLEFTHELGEAVREGLGRGVTDLWELTQLADERVGPYPEFMHELGASVRAHAGAVGG
jgi:glyoxylase-like metal-dependent hydrolase (beta-lactamase superfamily II)